MDRILYTIGYEGAEIAAFLTALQACDIKHVIDIRDVPVSRKRGFSKKPLAAALTRHGIDYSHLKALGDPKAGREVMRRGDYPTFVQIYWNCRKRYGDGWEAPFRAKLEQELPAACPSGSRSPRVNKPGQPG